MVHCTMAISIDFFHQWKFLSLRVKEYSMLLLNEKNNDFIFANKHRLSKLKRKKIIN